MKLIGAILFIVGLVMIPQAAGSEPFWGSFLMLLGVLFFLMQKKEPAVETAAEAAAKAAARDAGGVHWFWWVFWLCVFWPALIAVAIVHGDRKKRAAIAETKS